MMTLFYNLNAADGRRRLTEDYEDEDNEYE